MPDAVARRAMSIVRTTAALGLCFFTAAPAIGGQSTPDPANPPYLQDRGTGVSTSMFGTYIRKGELIVYPFFEYYRDEDFEYKPEEFGVEGDVDFRGQYCAHEGLIFLGYGISENLAIEFEAAVISASLRKSPMDASALPPRIEES